MKIELLHFAVFRESLGKDAETVVTMAATPRALYTELGLSRIMELDPHRLRVAVNDEFADWNAALRDGDRVAFIAPVAGG